jgi:hypothetical protein
VLQTVEGQVFVGLSVEDAVFLHELCIYLATSDESSDSTHRAKVRNFVYLPETKARVWQIPTVRQ